MKHRLFVCLFFLFCMLGGKLSSQNMEEKVNGYFQQLCEYPQEKLYLHLDKPYYAAGERIYWKGYLTDAIFHLPNTKSNFIYVELINHSNRILNKFKIKRDKGSFYGSILLPADTPAGEYYLRAYTQWMLNAGEEYFYYHKIRIGNALDRSVQASIRYEEGEKKDNCTVTIRFTNEQNKPLPGIRVENQVVVNGKKEKRYFRQTNKDGEIYFDMPIEAKSNERTIESTLKDGGYKFEKTFYIPLLGEKKNEFALSFFPEGGNLLDGCEQRVAFKVLQSDGNSCPLQGYVLSESGDTITTIRTEHDGMGVFTFTPSVGRKYKVKASRDNVFYREFLLPEVKPDGIQLSINHRKGVVRYNILKALNTAWQDTLYLVGHTRGNPLLFIPLTKEQAYGRFKDSKLPKGITELLLVNKAGTVLSRRLTFMAPDEEAKLAIEPFPSLAQRRELVELPLRITDRDGNPIQSSFSVSLTDRNVVAPDSLTDNIRSAFLLTSDLKGYIEDPGYYLNKKTPAIEYHTELLLLTHGWSRFYHTNIAQLPAIEIDHLMEVKQVITGKATKLLGGKAKKCPVVLIAPKEKLSAVTYTDTEGYFAFRDIQYRDTVAFVAQSKSKAGRATVFLEIDSMPYLPPHNPFPVIFKENSQFLEYDQAVRNSYLNEGGMQVIRLQEVTVTASARDNALGTYAGVNDYRISGDRLKQLSWGSALDLLGRIPRVQVMGNDVRILGFRLPPLFVIDGMNCMDSEGPMILYGFNANDIDAIELLKPESARLYFGKQYNTAGAVIVTLKEGVKMKKAPSPGLILFTGQGYNKSAEFYHPAYKTEEQKDSSKSDIRTTIYWNPTMQTDENGKAVIRFYTPDNLFDPHLIIEGITTDGCLVRLEK